MIISASVQNRNKLYRGDGLTRTMGTAKKLFELAPPCKSKFLTKKCFLFRVLDYFLGQRLQ